MITKNLIKFALLFCLIGLTACDNKLNPGFDPDDYEPIVPPEPVRTMDAPDSGQQNGKSPVSGGLEYSVFVILHHNWI